MSFLWPNMLWLLLAVPVLIGAYILLLRRRKKFAVRYANLATVKEAMGSSQRVRRHVPPLLFLLALILMVVAIARPTTVMMLPTSHETVILAVDVSGSMRASDVVPTRLAAAQAAVQSFVEQQPNSARVGVVSFAGTAAVVQPPTDNRTDIMAAIDRLQLQRGTAVGSGILVSLKTIFPDIEFELNSSDPRPRTSPSALPGAPLGEGQKEKPAFQPVPPGSYTSAAIILLTDGQTTTGPDPIEASRMAAERGVRVFTVGVGTPNGEILIGDGWSMRVSLDEDALKQIAKITDAEYFYAGNAEDLTKVYNILNSKLSLEKQETEITALFSALAAVFALASALLSMLWFNRIL